MSPFDSVRRHAALLASVAGNLVLAGCLLVMWGKGTGDDASRPTAMESVTQLVENSPKERVTSAQEAAAVPAFHWRQLDAPDFATFVKNLRAVGCPEATIRDIIHGELAEIYAAKRQEAESQIATAPEIAREVLKDRLQKLVIEETSLLASLTSNSAVATLSDTASVLPGSNNPAQAGTPAAFAEISEAAASQQDGSVLTPAAFLVGNDPSQPGTLSEISVRPTAPALDAATAQAIGIMRDGFAQSLAGAGDDPSSLIYRQRWLAAQRQSDEIYSSLFGGDGFVRTQAEAAQKQVQAKAR